MLITFEGIDGCGKSLIMGMVRDWLADEGYPVLATLEPGGSEFGQAFRKMLLESSFGSLDAQTETLLFMVDRSRHVEEIIRPALLRGEIVLCDRYIDSTLAYQGGGRGLNQEQLRIMNDFAVKGVYPDLTLLLSLREELAASRLGDSKDRLEQESLEFFRRVAAVYAALAAAEPRRFRVIDAGAEPQQVFIQAQTQIRMVLPPRRG
ncbi:MAG: dTMP kinase [Clostridia bacterium]|nr:dTMP kinase [Clostridia bacterium]